MIENKLCLWNSCPPVLAFTHLKSGRLSKFFDLWMLIMTMPRLIAFFSGVTTCNMDKIKGHVLQNLQVFFFIDFGKYT